MNTLIVVVFAAVYLGMLLGRWPGFALDRTGIALLGAIVLVGAGALSAEQAWAALDVPTMGLLFGLMVVSAQLRLGGFYTAVTRRLAGMGLSPAALLAAIIVVAGAFSALLCNDIVCLAMAPLLVEGCTRRNLAPLPHLLALACASNIGSGATLIGNPQNMLIGQRLGLPFAGYALEAAVPVAIGLAVVWIVIAWQWRGRWHAPAETVVAPAPAFSAWQTAKGGAVLCALVAAFLFTDIPREVAALAAAGVLLLSRRMHTRDMIALVDWHLLVLFGGLFVVHGALEHSGLAAAALENLRARGLDPAHPPILFVATVALSNLVSNVPATMLLLPAVATPEAGTLLALASTFAGNLILVGSIANIIVVDQAQRAGLPIGWAAHARTGVPVTIASLVVVAAWLWWLHG